MRGRLGNQLFQYAFARTLQKHNPKQKLFYLFNDVYRAGKIEDGWENSLQYFNTIDVVNTEQVTIDLPLTAKVKMKLYWRYYPHNSSIEEKHAYQMRWISQMEKSGLYYLDLGYYNFDKRCKSTTIVSGNFESEKYFSEIKESLIQEITPKTSILKHNWELINLIRETNSVCVSIRRGDYISDNFSGLLNICTETYYKKALDYMKRLVPNPTIFFFSDDIEWVKENVSVDLPCYYERGDDPVWEKLRLMYSCKHFIISNSTFSWWAQYLGRYPGKVVIAPNRWYNSDFISDLYMKEWHLIDV